MWTELFAKRPQDIKPGLERVQAALAFMPGLTTQVPGVTVGGTNGKGTTCGFLTQMLHAAGIKAGLYTSPHLNEFRERFYFDGRVLTNAEIKAELDGLKAKLPPAVYDDLSFFEVATLLAWQAFNARGSELNVMEVGLGGRFDATNVGSPIATIITSIGLDHCEFLGHDVATIAMEKSGIMRSARPVFWGGQRAGAPEAGAVIAASAKALKAPLWSLGGVYDAQGGRLQLELPGLPSTTVPLPQAAAAWPAYLVDNFANAAACFYWLLHQRGGGQSMFLSAIRRLDDPTLPRPPSLKARFERRQIAGVGEVLFDVCHNPQGATALAAGLSALYGGRRLPALISILGDKDHGTILDILKKELGSIVLFPAKSERALRREALAPRHQDLPWAPDLPTAWRLASGWLTAQQQGPLVACGSVHAVGEIMAFLEGQRLIS